MPNKEAVGPCKYCSYWTVHAPDCDRPRGDTITMFEELTVPVKVVVESKPVKSAIPFDPDANISVELVDKRHIVIRRYSQKIGMKAVNLHYNKAEEAEEYLKSVLVLAEQVGAKTIEECHNVYRFTGLAGKLVIESSDFGTKTL